MGEDREETGSEKGWWEPVWAEIDWPSYRGTLEWVAVSQLNDGGGLIVQLGVRWSERRGTCYIFFVLR